MALLLAVAYAAFAHGATTSPAETRLQVGIDAIAAVFAVALIWNGSLRIRAPRLAWAGLAALALFAAWCAITILWSVTPDASWAEFNRALSYVLVLGLAVGLGASTRCAVKLVANGFLIVAAAVTYYGLGQKLLPGLHAPGIFDLNQTGALRRLQEPLGYWNALALFIAMGVPIALAWAVDRDRGTGARLGAIVTLELMLLALGFTYSRGGVLALVIGLAAGIAISGVRLRSLLWLAVAAARVCASLARDARAARSASARARCRSRRSSSATSSVCASSLSAIRCCSASRARAVSAARDSAAVRASVAAAKRPSISRCRSACSSARLSVMLTCSSASARARSCSATCCSASAAAACASATDEAARSRSSARARDAACSRDSASWSVASRSARRVSRIATAHSRRARVSD